MALSSQTHAAPETVFWVSPAGDDTNPGNETRPFRSLEAARDAVRTLQAAKGLPEGGIEVRLTPGLHCRNATFLLEKQDSGAPGRPVVYTGVARDETRLNAGIAVPPSAIGKVTDPAVLARLPQEARANVVRINLRELGIDKFGPLPDSTETGSGIPYLFVGDRALTLARWPNDAWAEPGKTIDPGETQSGSQKNPRGGAFEYKEDRPPHWKMDGGLYVRGYFQHDWHHEAFRVAAIDTAKKTIRLARGGRYAVGGKFSSFKGRYIAFNVLEELDQPGEWHIDSTTGEVIFWPPEKYDAREIAFTGLDQKIIHAKDVSHLVIRNMTVELGRHDGVVFEGGAHNRLENCTLRNMDNHAGAIKGGSDHGVTGCEMYGMGNGGFQVEGGDRLKLEPAGHLIENCHIHHYGRLRKTYAGAVWLRGVGNRIAQCLVHDAPHTAFFYGGNDHTIEYNEMHHVILETGDAGATYTGRDWTSQGNVLRYNYIHDLGGVGELGSTGIYLDDCDSGDTVYGNIIVRAKSGILLGGGRDNTLTNNIVTDCAYGIRVDSRGETRMMFNTPGDSFDLQRKADAMNYRQPPWSERYPTLARAMEEMPTWPMYNEIAQNIIVSCKEAIHLNGRAKDVVTVHDNAIAEKNPGFADPAKGDFRLKPDAPILKDAPGFQQIPLEKIGLLR